MSIMFHISEKMSNTIISGRLKSLENSETEDELWLDNELNYGWLELPKTFLSFRKVPRKQNTI